MCITMVMFLCPFLLESPRLNLKLLQKLGIYSKLQVYLIALLHISNGHIKYVETRTKHLLCGIKGVRLISYTLYLSNEVGHPPLDSLMMCSMLTKFKKIYQTDFF